MTMQTEYERLNKLLDETKNKDIQDIILEKMGTLKTKDYSECEEKYTLDEAMKIIARRMFGKSNMFLAGLMKVSVADTHELQIAEKDKIILALWGAIKCLHYGKDEGEAGYKNYLIWLDSRNLDEFTKKLLEAPNEKAD